MPTLTTLTLQPTVTGTWPWTCGHVFKQGDLPAGQTLLGLQTNIRNYWPDGSAKIALVSGSSAVVSGTPLSVTIQTGSAASGTALTESDLAATGVQATLQFGAGPVVSLAALIGVAAAGASNGAITGGMVRQLASGPVMSSWLYCAPASSTNAHLIAWFEVRLYAGGAVQVLSWLENGWTRVASKSGQAGTLTFTLGGTTRFMQADVHIAAHCRVVAQDVQGVGYWLGTAPGLFVCPNPAYIQETGLTPSYLVDTSTATTRLNGLTQAYSPTTYGQLVTSPRDAGGNGTNNGEFDAGMSNAGYHAGIGVLPEWDAFYLSSGGDVRALRSVISNAMGYGRYGVHFRDENTLRPVSPADAVNKTLPQSGNHNILDIGANQFGGAETLPTPTLYNPGSGAIKPEYWAATHHPSAGYTAYLLTGHEYFLEQCQFVAGICFLRQNNVHRNYGSGFQYTFRETVRGAAWSLRTIFQAATISVDGSAIQTGFATIAANNIQQYHADYIASPCGSFGVPRPYADFNAGAPYTVNAWELDFWVAVWGYAVDLKPPVSSIRATELGAFFQWTGQYPVGRLGPLGDANSYGYNAAARQFSLAIANTSTDAPWIGNVGPWLSNWGEAFSLTWGTSNSTNTDQNLGLTGDTGFFPDATSYWGNLQPAIAYAVTHNVPGASAAYARMTGAPNWSSFLSSAATNPVWAVEPRAASAPASPPQGPTVRVDGTPLISGAVVVGVAGHGVLGSAVPTTGDDGGAILDLYLTRPYDDDVEVRWRVTGASAGVTIQSDENGAATVTVPNDGTHWIDYEIYKAGALFQTDRAYFIVGSIEATGTEPTAASDASSAIRLRLADTAEPMAATDQTGATSVSLAAIIDAVTSADLSSSTSSSSADRTEAAAASDQITSDGFGIVSAQESVTTADQMAASAQRQATGSEALAAGDAQATVSATVSAAQTETNAAGESVDSSSTRGAAAIESAVSGDQSVTDGNAVALITEAVAAGSSFGATANLLAAISEQITASEAGNFGALTILISVLESASPSDLVDAPPLARFAAVIESASALALSNHSQSSLVAAMFEALAASDISSMTGAFNATTEEVSAAGEDAIAFIGDFAAIVEAMTPADKLAVLKFFAGSHRYVKVTVPRGN